MENVDFHSPALWMALIGVWVLCFGALYSEWAKNARGHLLPHLRRGADEVTPETTTCWCGNPASRHATGNREQASNFVQNLAKAADILNNEK